MQSPPKQQPRILLIDDDKSFGKIMQKEGERVGVKLDYVPSLAKIHDPKTLRQFDAIFVDYDLEDGTGFEVAEVLASLAVNVPTIIVSSTDRPFQDELLKLPNIVAFVSKWMRPDEVMASAMQAIWQPPRALTNAEIS